MFYPKKSLLVHNHLILAPNFLMANANIANLLTMLIVPNLLPMTLLNQNKANVNIVESSYVYKLLNIISYYGFLEWINKINQD